MSSGKTVDVYGVGNALVDLQVRVDDAYLQHLKAAKGEMRLVDDAHQTFVLDELRGREVRASSGGSAANTMVGVAELGGTASYCGRVADDEHGRFYATDLDRVGIPLRGTRAEGRTGTCVVLITPDAQRTMYTNLGASVTLGPADVRPEDVAGARWVYVEGYLLPGESTRAAALKAIDVAKAQGAKVALTVSDPFIIGLCRDLIWDLVKGPVDLLFCNEAESQALARTDDPIECARLIHAAASSVALTLGAKGSILMHDHQVWPVEGVPVEAVDTTGAGDMYAAGILYGLTHGLDWPTSGHLASHAAARVVAHLGARMPKRFTAEEMRRLVERS